MGMTMSMSITYSRVRVRECAYRKPLALAVGRRFTHSPA